MLRGCSGDDQRLLRGLLCFSSFASPHSTGSAQPLTRLLYKFLTRLIIVWRTFWQPHKRITHSLTQQPCFPAINPAVSLGNEFGCCSPLAGSTGKVGELNQNKTSPCARSETSRPQASLEQGTRTLHRPGEAKQLLFLAQNPPFFSLSPHIVELIEFASRKFHRPRTKHLKALVIVGTALANRPWSRGCSR